MEYKRPKIMDRHHEHRSGAHVGSPGSEKIASPRVTGQSDFLNGTSACAPALTAASGAFTLARIQQNPGQHYGAFPSTDRCSRYGLCEMAY